MRDLNLIIMGNNNCSQYQTRSRSTTTMRFGSCSTRNAMIRIGSKMLTKRGIKSTYLKTTIYDYDSNDKCISSKISDCLHLKSIHKYVEKISVLIPEQLTDFMTCLKHLNLRDLNYNHHIYVQRN